MTEGAALMPELVAGLTPGARAAYLEPTDEFQREHCARRAWAWNLCSHELGPGTCAARRPIRRAPLMAECSATRDSRRMYVKLPFSTVFPWWSRMAREPLKTRRPGSRTPSGLREPRDSRSRRCPRGMSTPCETRFLGVRPSAADQTDHELQRATKWEQHNECDHREQKCRARRP